MNIFGGYKRFGPSDQDIDRAVSTHRRGFRAANRHALDQGLRRASQGAANRGMSGSTAVALGVPAIAEERMRAHESQEAQAAALRRALEAQRVQVYQQGWATPVLSGVLGLAGQLGGAALAGPPGAAAGGTAGRLLGNTLGPGAGAAGAGQGGVDAMLNDPAFQAMLRARRGGY